MKKFALAGVAGAALLAVPALAIQQGHARPNAEPMTRAAVETMVRARFAQGDADNDGFITKAEAEARISALRAERQAMRGERKDERFARLDVNGDGSVSRAEFDAPRGDRAERRANRGERRAERMERRGDRRALRGMRLGAKAFERMDADKDGRISLSDASARALARFDRMDADKDGRVTREERRAARQARNTG